MFTSWRSDGVIWPEYESKTWASHFWWHRWWQGAPCRLAWSQGKLHEGLQTLPCPRGYFASDKVLHPQLIINNNSGGGCGPFLQPGADANHCGWPHNWDLKWCRDFLLLSVCLLCHCLWAQSSAHCRWLRTFTEDRPWLVQSVTVGMALHRPDI